ncbi:MAG TPA: electron transfer flavoprotein subunit alpha/FixB family protein, partial [Chloroflexota bacterium]|nr:electron transfer flavoprotein subunit alpha/FixB family protein [Chloroflexota bacterium]
MANEQGVLIVAEVNADALAGVTAELAAIGRTLANDLGEPLIALLMGDNASAIASQLGELGVDRVLVADDPRLSSYQP